MTSKSNKHLPAVTMSTMSLIAVIFTCCVLRISSAETIAENDFRFISHRDLLSTANQFNDQNVTNFARLLFDVSRKSLIVGARDRIYRLRLDNLKLLQKAEWEVPKETFETCVQKGQIENDCRNFITVLHEYNHNLLACGTNAYSPNCSWRHIDNLKLIGYETGVGKSPFNPHANISTLMTTDGKMFVASPTDFSSSDPAIIRVDLAVKDSKLFRTKQYEQWFDKPQFVGSFEHDKFVYFVFREVAIELGSGGKAIYSRIARVCKNDNGGLNHYYKDNWTSFLKARLNCSLPGEYPFYFDEVQSISFSPEDGELYATFTTPENSIHGSAICVFNITTIDKAFNGPIKFQETPGAAWSEKTLHRDNYDCRSSHRIDISKNQMMAHAVQAIHTSPLYVSYLERFRHIAIDKIATKLHEHVRVVYISNAAGVVKKISVLPRVKKACLVESMQTEPSRRVLTMEFLKATSSLYIGMDNGLIRVSSQRCHRHVSRESCMNAMDPYCGWDDLRRKCSTPPDEDPLASHWYQNANDCPILQSTVDGAWSAWTPWSSCAQSGGADLITGNELDAKIDTCLCRTRTCDNPAPKNGGKECSGMSIMVTNCTVNGGWTDWSAYGPCSQSCGIAFKTRRRTCSNPAPKFGGRVCVGSDKDQIWCENLPPCPQATVNVQTDGQWGPWGDWSQCTAACSGGYRVRMRKCDSPAPLNGGLECIGCNIEYEICNKQPCTEVRKLSNWTPWLTVNGTASLGGNTYVEKRFRFVCKAPMSDPSFLKIEKIKEEMRNCTGEECRRVADAQSPKASWSCWSDWSPCSASCGTGRRVRYRTCLSASGDPVTEKDCDGSSSQDERCDMPSCDSLLGWSEWSAWSECNEDNEKVRTRQCTVMKPNPKECLGNEREVRLCGVEGSLETSPIASASLEIHWIGIIMIIFGSLCAIIAVMVTKYLIERKLNRLKRIQGSPHFIGAYPNQYSSLPTKDYVENNRPKRTSSFNGGHHAGHSKNINGTLTKSNNNMVNQNTPKILKYQNEVDMTTLKRNSALNNLRLKQIEDDKDKY